MTMNSLFSLLPLGLPLMHLLAALVCREPKRASWATWFSALGLLAAVASAVSAVALGGLIQTVPLISPAAASYVLAILVGLLGLIIVKFARNYLAGDSGQTRFATLLHLALASVATVVTSNNLFILLAAWMAVSLIINKLLLFYQNRPRAVLAAHKKFFFARTAETCLLVAFLLLYQQHGTAEISAIVSAYPAQLSGLEHIASVLLVIAALIKCAQLPMHGWLIQIVEAPTPVSALLHACVVNLGGYLLILFASLLSSSATAIVVLLIAAGLSTVLASLIMTTRVSIKVKLAWSTVAQMGLMLVECALGLYELALLHLVAHACYKAYQFLRSGSAVEQHLAQQLSPAKAIGPGAWIVSAAIAGCMAAAAYFAAAAGPISPWLLLAALITVLLAESSSRKGKHTTLISLAISALLVVAYTFQKLLLVNIAPEESLSGVGAFADAWVITLIVALASAWLLLRYAPGTSFANKLHNVLFAGLFLDEWVTRITLRLWPLRVPIRLAARPKRITALEVK